MAARIWIPPYKPLDAHESAVASGVYWPQMLVGRQDAESAAVLTPAMAEQLGRDNEAVVKAADVRLGDAERVLLFDPQGGYLNTRGEAALAQAPDVLEAYGKAQAREAAAMADDDQRRMLEELAQSRLATFTEQVERHGAAERLRWHDAASERRIAQLQADAGLHWSDDAQLRRALGTMRFEVRDQAERNGWERPLTETALRRQTSRTLVSAIEAAVERDPGRAQVLRTRYATVIENQDRVALDALLSEAQTRERAQAASTEILNATPPDGEHRMPQWRLRRAEAITDPDLRAATIRRLQSVAAADEARARTLAEQVLKRVVKDGLTDPSLIPVRDWMALDADRRSAIEARLDHNAAGTEPLSNPALVDELATQMTEAPSAFARRDLVPAVAKLPLTQWQRFRDWQAGVQRHDPATEDQLYAIRRGLRIAEKMLSNAELSEDSDNSGPPDPAPFRAALVEEIDTARRFTDKSPDDAALREMVRRSLPDTSRHNVGLHLDPHLARRLGALPWQALDTLSSMLLMLLMRSIALQSTVDKLTRAAPQSPPVPTPPIRADGWPSTKHSPVPNVREGQKHSEPATPRDALSPEFEKKWREPETFPQADRLPRLPGFTPAPPLKQPEGFTPAQPLPQPKGFTQQEEKFPTYLEARPKNDDEPWEWHHHIPQELWHHEAPNRFPFPPEVIEFFKKETVLIPNDEHWSDLHNAYNRTFRRALRAYIAKTKKARETEDDFARRMEVEEAREAYKYILRVILNPPEGLGEEEAKDAEDAK